MPNSVTFWVLVDRATKCCATYFLSFAWLRNHSFADSALVIVSWVVNVFDAMMNNVVSGDNFERVSARCVPSIFETK